MGQQCSCLSNEEENKIEKKLEDAERRMFIAKKESKQDENQDEDYMQVKYKAKAEFHKKSTDKDKNDLNTIDENNHVKTDNTLNNANNNIKDSIDIPESSKRIDINKVNMIIKNIANWFYQKKYKEKLKDILGNENEQLFKNLIGSENVKKLQNLSNSCKKPYKLDDWKILYPNGFPIDLSNIGIKSKNSEVGINLENIFGKTYKSRKIFKGNTDSIEEKSELNFKTESKSKNDIYSNANNHSKKNLIDINKEKITKNASSDSIYFKKNRDKNVLKNNVYLGDVNRYNQKHGKGILYYLDGSKLIEGTWFNDEPIGWIRIIYPFENGLVFEGIYQNGEFNGKGKIFATDESTLYEGEITSSKKHGYGIEKTTEQVYEGEFDKNKKHGKGKISFVKSNDMFEGDFIENKMYFGKYIWNENGNTYEGFFSNNKMHGKGTYIWKENGNIYEGEYKDGKKSGYGVIKQNDKILYEGEFLDGHPHGKGYRFDKKGVKIEVSMEHGKAKKEANKENKSFSPKKLGLKQRILENKFIEDNQ